MKSLKTGTGKENWWTSADKAEAIIENRLKSTTFKQQVDFACLIDLLKISMKKNGTLKSVSLKYIILTTWKHYWTYINKDEAISEKYKYN